MQRALAFALVVCASAAALGQAADNKPPTGDHELMFTGKDLDNWISDPDTLPHWVVKEGIIHADGKGKNLVSERNYRDFELLIDWKAEPGSNGGIWVRGRPKIAIVDPAMNDAGSGGLVNNKIGPKQPTAKADKPAGEWNTFKIEVVDNKATVTLNDQVVVNKDTVMENAADSSRKLPFTGKIELEAVGPIQFKNIYIRPIKKN